MNHASARIALLLSVGVGGSGCQDPDPSSCDPYWPDTPSRVVDISADPPAVRLVELWRAGGSADGQEIADPASVSANSQGAVAVVDLGLSQVSVISPYGEWLGSWGRQGRGPGELTMPVAANWSGDTLVVFDIDQNKVARYVKSVNVSEIRVPAEFVAPVAMTGMIDFVAVASDGTVMLQQPLAVSSSADSSAFTILAQPPGASVADTLLSTTVSHVEWNGSKVVQPGTAVPVAAVGADGWLAQTAGNGSYRIAWGQGNLNVQLCAPVSPLRLTDEERGAGDAPQGFEVAAAAFAAAQPPAALSHVGRVVLSSAGDLWVDRRRPRPFSREKLFGAPGGTVDIFASSGDYVGRAVIPDGVSIQAVSDSTAIGIEFSDLDEMTIVAYRLIR